MKTERILVVDDDEKICQLLTIYLRSRGYEVTVCKNGANAIQFYSDSAAELILLDITLPGLDGFRILNDLRRISNVPIIMVSTHSSLDEKIRALDMGADDYIIKPFDCKELVARIRAVLRRCGGAGQFSKRTILAFDAIVLDRDNRTVTIGGHPASLAPKEFDLLELLMLNRESVVTRDSVFRELWNGETSSRSLDVHIRRLRKKLTCCCAEIETVHGVGYKLTCKKTDKAF